MYTCREILGIPVSDELPTTVSVEEVHQLVQTGQNFVLLDCRSEKEYEQGNLPNARLIPMDELPQRVTELANHRTDRIVVYCHMGVRSEMVSNWLRGQGFLNAQTMTGGIEEWSGKVDRTLPRY